jgi:L-fucose mutarotase/ribose pyranase (RbsD/FucU family)
MILSSNEIRHLLIRMGHGEGSIIRPDPNFTAQHALALAERLKAALKENAAKA